MFKFLKEIKNYEGVSLYDLLVEGEYKFTDEEIWAQFFRARKEEIESHLRG